MVRVAENSVGAAIAARVAAIVAEVENAFDGGGVGVRGTVLMVRGCGAVGVGRTAVVDRTVVAVIAVAAVAVVSGSSLWAWRTARTAIV
jgi:hypothetical protein